MSPADGDERRPCRDEDLTFFMSVHHDHALADACLGRLRRHFPAARVVVRSDGDDDPRHPGLAGRHGVDFRLGPRLFPVANGGALVQRMFEAYLERPTAYLFKIDPDTVVHRRFRYLPGRDGHFGTVQGRTACKAIQGGCMGFTRGAAEAIAGSGLLADPRLADPVPHRDRSRYWHNLARRAERDGLASFDWTLGWAASKLGVPLFEFDEVRSAWREPVDNPGERYAVTHPAP